MNLDEYFKITLLVIVVIIVIIYVLLKVVKNNKFLGRPYGMNHKYN